MREEMKYPNIEAERARRGWSATKLCEQLGVNRKTYYNWTRKGHIPQSKLEKLAELFECSTDYLLGIA